MPANTTIALSIVDAVIKRGAPNTTTLPPTIAVDTCEDVTLKVSVSEAKANNRKSRHEQSLPAMYSDEIDITFPADSADTHLAAFITAFTTPGPIPIKVADKTGMIGLQMIAYVASWEDPNTMPDVPKLKFTLKPFAVGVGGTQPSFVAG